MRVTVVAATKQIRMSHLCLNRALATSRRVAPGSVSSNGPPNGSRYAMSTCPQSQRHSRNPIAGQLIKECEIEIPQRRHHLIDVLIEKLCDRRDLRLGHHHDVEGPQRNVVVG